MLQNYLSNAYRYLSKHPLTTAINVLGLAVGISVCYFALLYVDFELSYDAYHREAGQIYRLVTDINTATDTYYESTSAPMMPAVQANFPEVAEAVRLLPDYLIVQKEDRTFFAEEDIAYADSTFFSVFSFPLIRGNARYALQKPMSVVLSATAAARYFGTTDCLGEVLLLDDNPAVVTAVMEDMPFNTHFRTDILVSMATLLEEWNPKMQQQWQRFGFYSYLQLQRDSDVAQLEKKISVHINQQIVMPERNFTMQLEPLESIYLEGKVRGSRYGSISTGDIEKVYIFGLVAVFILFIAGFNFINLTTGLSVQRAREIGVRKVLGASRKQLILQFLTDTLCLSLLALAVALLLCVLLLPGFNQLAGKTIRLELLEHWSEIGWLLAGTLVLGFLSGIYPAFFLSAFPGIQSLKGSKLPGSRESLLNKTLIVVQFTLAMIFISATGIVYQQLYYMQQQALGYEKEQKLVLDFHYDSRITARMETVKQEFSAIAGVETVAFSSSLPGRANRQYLTAIENTDGSMYEYLSDVYFIDYNFIEQYQISILAGRPFDPAAATDSAEAMLVNEATVRSLGYSQPEEVLGMRFEQQGRSGRVIGVVRDFHFQSLREEIRPLSLQVSPGWNLYTFITLGLNTRDLPATLSRVEELWSSVATGKPFLYFFVDDAFQAQYAAERRFARFFGCLAFLALLLSCLGLLGLAAFHTKTRFKEIGIRKVLGASLGSLLLLMSGPYLRLILLAMLVGIAVTNYFMSEWLMGFAYRAELNWWLYAVPATIVMLIALTTISSQTLSAALQNPVDSLRDE